MNVVMTSSGRLVEIQGTAEPNYSPQGTYIQADEEAPSALGRRSFSQKQLLTLLKLARKGIAQLTSFQRKALGEFPLQE
jgi:ribonuclease PH